MKNAHKLEPRSSLRAPLGAAKMLQLIAVAPPYPAPLCLSASHISPQVPSPRTRHHSKRIAALSHISPSKDACNTCPHANSSMSLHCRKSRRRNMQSFLGTSCRNLPSSRSLEAPLSCIYKDPQNTIWRSTSWEHRHPSDIL